MEDLKPCPFCGGAVDLWETGYGVVTVFQCRDCKARVLFPWDKTETAVEKSDAWNTRAGAER